MMLDKAAVEKLVGNPSTFANGQQLAADAHWARYGVADDLIWGECKGSGIEPYQVSFRLSDRTAKCNCPSRQRPCKHIAGLMIRYVNQSRLLNADPAPQWIQQRQQQANRKSDTATAPPQQTPATPPDQPAPPPTLLTIEAKRRKLTDNGIALLERWLEDAMRLGALGLSRQPEQFWTNLKSRLVDCQLAPLNYYVNLVEFYLQLPSQCWPALLLPLCRLHLFVRMYRQMHRLTPEQQAALWVRLGRTLREEEAKSLGQRCNGQWQIVGVVKDRDADTEVETTTYWLAGTDGRFLYHRQYSYRGRNKNLSGIPFAFNDTLLGEWVCYPAFYPLRAAPLEVRFQSFSPSLAGFSDFPAMLEAYARALQQDPWLEEFPAICDKVKYLATENAQLLCDERGYTVPAVFYRSAQDGIQQGKIPIHQAQRFFGLWTGSCFRVLSLWAEQGQLISLSNQDPGDSPSDPVSPDPWPSAATLIPPAMKGTTGGLSLLKQLTEAILRDLGGYTPPQIRPAKRRTAVRAS